jgi:uncharacterized membrane protein
MLLWRLPVFFLITSFKVATLLSRSVCRNRQAIGVDVPHVLPSLMGVVRVETCSQTPLAAGRCLKVYSGFEGGATSEEVWQTRPI